MCVVDVLFFIFFLFLRFSIFKLSMTTVKLILEVRDFIPDLSDAEHKFDGMEIIEKVVYIWKFPCQIGTIDIIW